MPTLVGFGTFAALPEEEISEKISRRILSGDQGMLVWWSIGAGVHVEPHSHANEQIVWMLKGKMEFRLGSEQRVCGPGDVVVIPGGAEHEGWFREDSEVRFFDEHEEVQVSDQACGRSQHYQTKMGGPRDRFGATVGIELGEDRRDMELGGVERDS
jgi:quercetin dioxygenase-like cupin family protein